MTSGKVTLALLQLPALFHYGETLVTTTCARPFCHVRQFFFCDKAKLSLENMVFGGLGTGEASVALSPFFEVAG